MEFLEKVLTYITEVADKPNRLGREVIKSLQEVLYQPSHDVIHELMSSLPRLATDLEKEDPEYKLVGDNVGITKGSVRLFDDIFSHLLRNSMDHGIETANQRLEVGKAKNGCINISIKDCHSHLLIEYSDDGRGLNLDAIRSKAEESGMITPGAALSKNEVAELVFTSGLSTAESITEISGRGVGISARPR